MTEEKKKKKIKIEHSNSEIKQKLGTFSDQTKNQEIKQKLETFSYQTKNQESIKDDSINLDNIEENNQQKNDSNPDSWDPESLCWGCREGQPNQLAHMDPGGCLYQEESDDE